jgi:hypothetical protein
MSDSKILLTFKDDKGNYQTESVWATKQGEYYRIDNIPFLAPNIAFHDIVSVEEDDGVLYFDDLVKASHHSTIQMIIFDEGEVALVGKELEDIQCTWEGSHIKNLIAIDVPKEVPYLIVKEYLDKGENENRWSYKEACLGQ